MITLSTNSLNFIWRFFFLAGIFFLEYLLINFGHKGPNSGRVIFQIAAIHFEFKAIHVLYFLIAFLGFLASTVVMSLLSVNKVRIDTTANAITFYAVFTRRKVVAGDIKEYIDLIHRNSFRTWIRLLIRTNDNRSIQLAGQNINSLSHLKDYLNDRKIVCSGRMRMKFPFN